MAVNVAVLIMVLVGTVASQRCTSAEAADGMMASMPTAMPPMMTLRICLLSFVEVCRPYWRRANKDTNGEGSLHRSGELRGITGRPSGNYADMRNATSLPAPG